MIVKDKIEPEVIAAIDKIVRPAMAPFGFKKLKVRADEDHDGDPILAVEVFYSSDDVPIDTKVVAGLVAKVQDRLLQMGEERFAHIHHHFSDRRKVVGDK